MLNQKQVSTYTDKWTGRLFSQIQFRCVNKVKCSNLQLFGFMYSIQFNVHQCLLQNNDV